MREARLGLRLIHLWPDKAGSVRFGCEFETFTPTPVACTIGTVQRENKRIRGKRMGSKYDVAQLR